jgi:1-acyl-sn-glycerol-3-phosphate acyltransferase
VPIVPVAVRGTDVLRPFSRIDVTIGPSIKPDAPAWWELSRRVTQVVENVRLALARGLRGRRA